MSYIARHWRGEQNIIWSLLVNGVAVWVTLIAGAAFLAVFAGVPEHVLAWGIPALLAWLVWAVVGIVRAAVASLRDRNSRWTSKFVALLAFAGLALIALGAYNDLSIVRRWLLSQ